jgi:plasmid maintenance system antidote protein VapI
MCLITTLITLPNRGNAMPSDLSERLSNEIKPRGKKSIRSLAGEIDIAPNTLARVLDDKKVDNDTLDKIAKYLVLPKETVYRMAEVLPQDPERDRIVRLAMHLFDQLPEDRQQRLLAQLELEVKLWEQDNQT